MKLFLLALEMLAFEMVPVILFALVSLAFVFFYPRRRLTQ